MSCAWSTDNAMDDEAKSAGEVDRFPEGRVVQYCKYGITHITLKHKGARKTVKCWKWCAISNLRSYQLLTRRLNFEVNSRERASGSVYIVSRENMAFFKWANNAIHGGNFIPPGLVGKMLDFTDAMESKHPDMNDRDHHSLMVDNELDTLVALDRLLIEDCLAGGAGSRPVGQQSAAGKILDSYLRQCEEGGNMAGKTTFTDSRRPTFSFRPYRTLARYPMQDMFPLLQEAAYNQLAAVRAHEAQKRKRDGANGHHPTSLEVIENPAVIQDVDKVWSAEVSGTASRSMRSAPSEHVVARRTATAKDPSLVSDLRGHSFETLPDMAQLIPSPKHASAKIAALTSGSLSKKSKQQRDSSFRSYRKAQADSHRFFVPSQVVDHHRQEPQPQPRLPQQAQAKQHEISDKDNGADNRNTLASMDDEEVIYLETRYSMGAPSNNTSSRATSQEAPEVVLKREEIRLRIAKAEASLAKATAEEELLQLNLAAMQRKQKTAANIKME